MSKLPTLTAEQFALVSETFGTIVAEDLGADAAQARIAERAAGDDEVAQALTEMWEAHASEGGADDTTGAFQAQAIEAVEAETRAAGEEIERHVPERIGPYRIVRFVASGGMGTVYEAEQDEPRRRVAIKVIRLELLTRESIQRFEAEGHLLARLKHRGIAQVFAMGRMETPAGSVPYLVLEFVDGVPITEYVERNAVDRRGRVELLRQVGDAVQYAHDNGVLHRDLKPGNILVDAKGRAHVLDFGIGRALDDDRTQASLTATGLFLGTLAYMSPEQAVRSSKPLDVRVDVYGLGAVGYELLAGRPPQAVKDLPLHVAIERVSQRESPSLESVDDATISGDLSAIFTKALATDPPASLPQHPRLRRRPRALSRPPARRGATPVTSLPRQEARAPQPHDLRTARAPPGEPDRWAGRCAHAAGCGARRRGAGDPRGGGGDARPTGRAPVLGLGVGRVGARVRGPGDAGAVRGCPGLVRAPTHHGARTQPAVRFDPIEGLPAGSSVYVSFGHDRGAAIDPKGRLLCVDLDEARCRPMLRSDERFKGSSFGWCATKPTWLAVSHEGRLTVIDSDPGTVLREVATGAPRVRLDVRNQDLHLWGRNLVGREDRLADRRRRHQPVDPGGPDERGRADVPGHPDRATRARSRDGERAGRQVRLESRGWQAQPERTLDCLQWYEDDRARHRDG